MQICRLPRPSLTTRTLSVVHACGHETEYICCGDFSKPAERVAYREAWLNYPALPCPDCKGATNA